MQGWMANGRRWARATLAGAVLLAAAGCATDDPLAAQRVPAYVPRVASVDRMPWQADPAPAPGAVPAVGVAAPAPAPASGGGLSGRQLRRDDKVLMSLRGIPRPEEIADVVDAQGNVTLPHVNEINVEGLTTAEAEDRIERAYVEGGYYSKIDVIMVAQEDAFFVQGEVQRPGKYPLVGDTTVLMAISSAGGYTDYANRRKIRVIRGGDVMMLNGERIERREDEDLLIQANDLIIVDRKLVL